MNKKRPPICLERRSEVASSISSRRKRRAGEGDLPGLLRRLFLLVESCGIEPLTFPALNAGKPPSAAMIEKQEVSGCTIFTRTNEKTEDQSPRFSVGGDKRDRTADLSGGKRRKAAFGGHD